MVIDTDGSAFITKAEFDSLKNNFQAQIDSYNSAIDSKIDGAIASYLSGIQIASTTEQDIIMNTINFTTPEDVDLNYTFPESKWGLYIEESAYAGIYCGAKVSATKAPWGGYTPTASSQQRDSEVLISRPPMWCCQTNSDAITEWIYSGLGIDEIIAELNAINEQWFFIFENDSEYANEIMDRFLHLTCYKTWILDTEMGGVDAEKKFIKGAGITTPRHDIRLSNTCTYRSSTWNINTRFYAMTFLSDCYVERELKNTISGIGTSYYGAAFTQIKGSHPDGLIYVWKQEDRSTENLWLDPPAIFDMSVGHQMNLIAKTYISNPHLSTGYLYSMSTPYQGLITWYTPKANCSDDSHETKYTNKNVRDIQRSTLFSFAPKTDSLDAIGIQKTDDFGSNLWCDSAVGWDYKNKKLAIWDRACALKVASPSDLGASTGNSWCTLGYKGPWQTNPLVFELPDYAAEIGWSDSQNFNTIANGPVWFFPVTENLRYSLQDLYSEAWYGLTDYGQHFWDGMAISKLNGDGAAEIVINSSSDTTLYFKKATFDASDDRSNILPAEKNGVSYSNGVPISAGESATITIYNLSKDDVIYAKPSSPTTIGITRVSLITD